MSVPAVAHITGSLSRLAGGPFVSVRSLAREQALQGLARPVVYGAVDDYYAADRAEWDPVPLRPYRPWGPARLGCWPGLGGSLSRRAPELVHVSGLWALVGRSARVWCRRRGVPLVVSPRGMLEPWAWQHHAARKRLLWRLFERENLRAAACLHVTSTAEAEAVRERLPGVRTAVIPNGVELPPGAVVARGRQQACSRRERLALFLSRIHPKKGLMELIAAWARVRPAGWRLMVCGFDEGGHQAQVQEEAARAGILDAVSFPGPTTGSEKWELLASADLFVLPTHSENFGIAVAEALAAGVPVLTTQGAPWQGLETRDCGWWVPVGVEGAAAALAAATALDRDVLRAKGDRGRAWMRDDFGWPGIARRMSELYRDCLAQAATRA